MFPTIFLLLIFSLINLLELLSFDKLDLLYDESNDDGSGSGYPGTCAFPFFSEKYVGSVGKCFGSVSGVGSGVFVLNGIESIVDVVMLVVFLPIGVESKVGQLIELVWLPKS